MAAAEAQSRRLTDHLVAIPDEVVIATVVRRQARSVLQRPRFDDPLLPVPEGVVDPLEPWMFPSQVIDSADTADLARVILRWWLAAIENSVYPHRHREMEPVHKLAATLPAPPEDDPPADEEVA